MKMDAEARSEVYDNADRAGVVVSLTAGYRFDKHLLTIETTGTPSAGTATIYWRGTPGGRWFQLKDEFGVARTLAMASEDSIEITGPIDAVKIDMASLATATAWQAVLRGFQ